MPHCVPHGPKKRFLRFFALILLLGTGGLRAALPGGGEDCSQNTIPTASFDSAEANPGYSVVIDVMANDFDVDGNLLPNSVRITQSPDKGTAEIDTDGTVLYVADGDQYNTTDTFNYVVRDSCGAVSNVATCQVTIVGDPDPLGGEFCHGDSTCPNGVLSFGGCSNSNGVAGVLTAWGWIVHPESITLQATGLFPNQPCMFFQGNNTINNGNGLPFGDGLRCIGLGLIRLQTVIPWGAGEADTDNIVLFQEGGVQQGDVRHYQCWYRDSASTTNAGFNLTNAVTIAW